MIRKRESSVKRVGIWIRVSTEDQVRGESPETHERRARLYAEAKGWTVIEVYRLDAVSGKTVKEHPEAKRMLADIAGGQITGLIFSKLARLARNTKELLEFAETFRAHDADLISLAESIDTSSPAGRLFYTMIAAMAQWEREEIAARVAASVPIRAKMGKPLGGAAPFGYRWDDKRLVVDPKEAPVRKLLHELFREHRRKKTVARLLNEKGFRTRGGAKFSDTTVDRLLRDPVAKGLRRANYTSSTGSGKGWVLKPESEWVHHEVEAIVSEDLWDEANAILTAQKEKGRRQTKRVAHLFSGLTFCHCGQKMYVPSNTPKYLCTKCRNKIPVEDLEAIFHEQLRNFFVSPKEIAEHLALANETLHAKEELLGVLESERDKLSKEVDKLYDLYQSGAIDKTGFGDKYKPLSVRLAQLADEIPKGQAEVDVLKISQLSQEEIISEARDLYARWTDLAKDEKRRIVEAITERIVVGVGEVEISLLYSPPTPHTPRTPPDDSTPPSGRGGHGILATKLQSSVAFLPWVRVTLKCLKPDGIPDRAKAPHTLGDHLLAKRLALGLHQKTVAKMMGISEESYLSWETNQYEPRISMYPAIYAFLGTDPLPPPETFPGRLRRYRQVRGLSVEKAAKLIGVDEGTWARWEIGKRVQKAQLPLLNRLPVDALDLGDDLPL